MTTGFKRRIKQVPLIAMALAMSACGKKSTPPINVSFRHSVLDSAKLVMIVRNTGDRSLSCLMTATNKTLNQQNQYPFSLGPRDSSEIGWMQTNWSFQSGETVTLAAEGYASR